MLLIDALYINNGGGKVLLDYILLQYFNHDEKPFLLLDSRIENQLSTDISSFKYVFINSFIDRYRFYLDNRFDKVLCFGNIPPPVYLSAQVFTYFHQPLFLEIPESFNLKNKCIYFIKSLVLRKLKRNTTFWLVQSEYIKDKLSKKYKIEAGKIKTLPFYPPLSIHQDKEMLKRNKNSYIYISNAPPHKNHIRLISAFCLFFDKHKIGNLTLTVNKDFPELLDLINQKIDMGYPIINIGFVPRDQLAIIYQESEYLIYPSLAESFGLGLVEAIENGCKVIGANLPYTYAVCEPSLAFNPMDEESIFNALCLSLEKELKPSISKVSNNIDALLSLL